MLTYDGLISLLIACFELVFLVNLIFFAEKNKVNKLAMLVLLLLIGYQVIEFLICYAGLQKQIFIYSAFLDITLLPPLSLYMVLKFLGKSKKYYPLIFLPAVFFIIYYPFILDQFAVTKCTVLYASYHYPIGEIYGAFYYMPILTVMIILYKKRGNEKDKKERSLTRLLFLGYVLTFIPAMIAAIVLPTFINAVESLLCKFAFILAVFLSLFVLKNRTSIKKN